MALDLQPSPPTRRPQPQAAHSPPTRAEQPGWVLHLGSLKRPVLASLAAPNYVASVRHTDPVPTLRSSRPTRAALTCSGTGVVYPGARVPVRRFARHLAPDGLGRLGSLAPLQRVAGFREETLAIACACGCRVCRGVVRR